MATTARSLLQLTVDGQPVEVEDDGGSLLDLLRERLRLRSVKDGCSPQGQCGCCTVLVDGHPRAACVTAARRAAGRQVVTVAGLEPEVRERWAQAFVDHGASQCGFCTPGIVLRLVGMTEGRPADRALVERSLAAHLCRCTGWRTIVDAALAAATGGPGGAAAGGAGAQAGGVARPGGAAAGGVAQAGGVARPGGAAAAGGLAQAGGAVRSAGAQRPGAEQRASLEAGSRQQVGVSVVVGDGGFADDLAPADCLVAVPDGTGGWVLGETLADARRQAGRTPGRNSTLPLRHPLELPPGQWELSLQTTFVEPAYLELDASWCVPGGEPASPLANGGAFGGKLASPAPAAARQLADRTGRPVRVVLGREDVVRLGPKRPPVAAGVAADGRGVVRVARTPGSSLARWAEALAVAAPGLQVEVVDVAGPPVSAAVRAAGWAEGAVLMAALSGRRAPGSGGDEPSSGAAPGGPVTVVSPTGARATAEVAGDGSVAVTVEAGRVLDEVVLRSYAVGAAHQALGWVRREGIAVDPEGTVHDLTLRSFGILAARDTPPVTVAVVPGDGPPVAAGDAVLAAVAAAAWASAGFACRWPVERS